MMKLKRVLLSGLGGIFGLVVLCSIAAAWQANVNGNVADSFDQAWVVTADAAGDVLAAGFTENIGTGRDFTTVKSDGATGDEIWRRLINGSANSSDRAYAVTVDAAGNVVAAGVTVNIDTGADFTVIKFDGATGDEMWRQVINGSLANSNDEAYAITVDAAGDVLAAGRTQNIGTSSDFTVVKLRGTDGGDF